MAIIKKIVDKNTSGTVVEYDIGCIATNVTQDAGHRFVTDQEKSNWNSKPGTSVATTNANGLMSKTDKSKLDGIAAGANNYTHPSTHAASMITQDATHRMVTDTEKGNWNAKAGTSVATAKANGLMSKADKSKLDGIAAGANNYTHPNSGATAGTYKSVTVNAQGHVTAGSNPTTLAGYGITDAANISHSHNYAGSSSAGGAATTALSCSGNAATSTKATQDSAGQQINTTYIKGLSANGKVITYTKGNGTTATITTQDTVYSHPNSGVTAGTYKSVTVTAQGHITSGTNPTTLSGYGITDAAAKSHTHSASQITQDSTHRFTTDSEKSRWNSMSSSSNNIITLWTGCAQTVLADIPPQAFYRNGNSLLLLVNAYHTGKVGSLAVSRGMIVGINLDNRKVDPSQTDYNVYYDSYSGTYTYYYSDVGYYNFVGINQYSHTMGPNYGNYGFEVRKEASRYRLAIWGLYDYLGVNSSLSSKTYFTSISALYV